MKTSCKEIREELGSFIDKQLSAEVYSEIEAHTRLCNECKNELVQLEKTLQIVDSWKINTPKVDIYGKIQRKIAKPSLKPIILRLSVASCAAAIVAFVLLKTIDFQPQRDPAANESVKNTEPLSPTKNGNHTTKEQDRKKLDNADTKNPEKLQTSENYDVTKDLIVYYKLPLSKEDSLRRDKVEMETLKDKETTDGTKEGNTKLFAALEELGKFPQDGESTEKTLALKDLKSSFMKRFYFSSEPELKTDENLDEKLKINHRKEKEINIWDFETPYGFFCVFYINSEGKEKDKLETTASTPISKTVHTKEGKTIKILSYNKRGIQITIMSHELSWGVMEQLKNIF